MSETIRSFICVEVDDTHVEERLAEAQQAIVATGADLKMVKLENLHLTLRFLGEIRPSVLEAVKKEINLLRFTPFDIVFRGLGVFPNLGHINVFWIGVAEGVEKMSALSDMVELAVRKAGLPSEKRGFSPHLTLARVKSGRSRDNLSPLISRLATFDAGSMPVKLIKLKKSILTPSGPIYSTIQEVVASG